MMEEILDYMKYGIWEQLLISPEKERISGTISKKLLPQVG